MFDILLIWNLLGTNSRWKKLLAYKKTVLNVILTDRKLRSQHSTIIEIHNERAYGYASSSRITYHLMIIKTHEPRWKIITPKLNKLEWEEVRYTKTHENNQLILVRANTKPISVQQYKKTFLIFITTSVMKSHGTQIEISQKSLRSTVQI